VTRLWAVFRWDVVRQYRSGFYLVSLLLVPLLAGLIRATGDGADRYLLAPGMLVMLLLITTFYFSAAILLLEKGEGSLAGLAVTPLRTWEYLAARTASLTLLATAEGLLILLAGLGLGLNLLQLVPGMVAICAIYTLTGTALITRYDSINEFLLPSAGAVVLLLLPLLGELGIWDSPLHLGHPLHAPIVLLRAAVRPVTPLEIGLAMAASLVWIAVLSVIARVSLERFVIRSAGT
jgi:fluoroquinolone transport system permease protein